MPKKTPIPMLALSVLLLSACGGGNELADGQEEVGVPLDELEEAAMAGPDGPASLAVPWQNILRRPGVRHPSSQSPLHIGRSVKRGPSGAFTAAGRSPGALRA